MAPLDDPGVRVLLEEQVDHAVCDEQRTRVLLEPTRVRHQKQG